jgi:hypothetical protein
LAEDLEDAIAAFTEDLDARAFESETEWLDCADAREALAFDSEIEWLVRNVALEALALDKETL